MSEKFEPIQEFPSEQDKRQAEEIRNALKGGKSWYETAETMKIAPAEAIMLVAKVNRYNNRHLLAYNRKITPLEEVKKIVDLVISEHMRPKEIAEAMGEGWRATHVSSILHKYVYGLGKLNSNPKPDADILQATEPENHAWKITKEREAAGDEPLPAGHGLSWQELQKKMSPENKFPYPKR